MNEGPEVQAMARDLVMRHGLEAEHDGYVIVVSDADGGAMAHGPYESPREAQAEANAMVEEDAAVGLVYESVVVIPLSSPKMKESPHA